MASPPSRLPFMDQVMAKRRHGSHSSDDDGLDDMLDAPETETDPEPAAAETSKPAAEHLAELEEKLFQGRAARIEGRIERGYGSLFRALPEADRKHLLALEELVDAEAAVVGAKAMCAQVEQALTDAEKRYDDARADANAAKEAADEKAGG